MIIRDDDVSIRTCPHLFKQLHQQFIAAGKIHTCAVLMRDLWENHALFYYLNIASHMSVQLHGWNHVDYSKMSREECVSDLKKSIDYWNTNSKRMLGTCTPMTTFFAPWNHVGEGIVQACKDVGLRFCAVRDGEWEGEKVVSFHWWNVMKDGFRVPGL